MEIRYKRNQVDWFFFGQTSNSPKAQCQSEVRIDLRVLSVRELKLPTEFVNWNYRPNLWIEITDWICEMKLPTEFVNWNYRLNFQCRICNSGTRWGTADAEITAPSAEIQKQSKVRILKLGVGQYVTLHASIATKCSFLFLCLPGSFNCVCSQSSSNTKCVCYNSGSRIYWWCDDLCVALMWPSRLTGR